jgi:addiction module RelE/StbE family toxin
MKVQEIHVHKVFISQFQALPKLIQKKAIKAETLFRENPLHPSLRLHKLQGKMAGLWSISLDKSYRIIFEALEDGNILFVSIGRHSIYK